MSRFPAPRWSLWVAVLGSAALHALLLCEPWQQPRVAAQSRVQVIEARLLIAAAPQAAQPVAEPAAPQPEPASPARVIQAAEPAPSPKQPAAPVPAPPVPAPPPERAALAAPPPPVLQPPQAAPSRPSATATPEPAGAAAASPSPSVYLPASELDPPPRPLTEIRLTYPPGAGMRSGEVVLDLLIGTSGVVEDVKIIEAMPQGLFEASAIAAFVATRFAPGLKAGVAVAARMRVAVQFSTAGMGVAVAGTVAQPQQQPILTAPR